MGLAQNYKPYNWLVYASLPLKMSSLGTIILSHSHTSAIGPCIFLTTFRQFTQPKKFGHQLRCFYQSQASDRNVAVVKSNLP